MEPGDRQDRLGIRERAALEDRHWVRLTRCCNNRCLFCLDAEAQDGSSVAFEAVRDEIRRGAALGRERLVLSGGEPTVHPRFVELVAAGARAGFSHVQVVTNGRMLASSALLRAALDAGLDEVTVSLHGHLPGLHDRLVGVPGAFAETVRGIRAALGDGRPVVSVDVVVCRRNVAHLESIVALCLRLGVREIDLLQVQPAGRASEPGADALYDPAEQAGVLSRVFELGRRPDLFLWTNRFPVFALEGHEELVQDPHKLVDEVRGRAEHVERLLRDGRALPCRGARCAACYLEPLCEHLHDYARRLGGAGFDEALFDLRNGRRPAAVPDRLGGRLARSRLLVRSVADALALPDGALPGRSVALWLDGPDGLDRLDRGGLHVGGLPVRRLAGARPEVLEAAADLGVEEVEAAPGRATEAWLAARAASLGSRLVVRPAPRERASDARAEDLPPARLDELLRASQATVEDLPPCLAGGRPVRWTEPALEPDAAAGGSGPVDLELLVARFAAGRFRARSARCRACAARRGCQGLEVQRVRAFGLGCLRPVG